MLDASRGASVCTLGRLNNNNSDAGRYIPALFIIMIKYSPISHSIYCEKCESNSDFLVVKQIIRSGADVYLWWCSICQTSHRSGFIKKEDVIKNLPICKSLEDIPLARYDCGERCAKCGVRGTELHHWAPQGLFDDAESWPKDYLCKKCHNLWHKKINVKMIKWAMSQC